MGRACNSFMASQFRLCVSTELHLYCNVTNVPVVRLVYLQNPKQVRSA